MNAPHAYAGLPDGAQKTALQSFELAERGVRLLAAVLDGIIFFGMTYLPFVVIALASGGVSPVGGERPSMPLLGFGMLVSLVGTVAWVWITTRSVVANGQTIAKRALGIKVVRTDGTPVSLSRIFWLRNVVNIVLGIVPFYGLVDVLFIFGAGRRCLHDKIADTIVVKA